MILTLKKLFRQIGGGPVTYAADKKKAFGAGVLGQKGSEKTTAATALTSVSEGLFKFRGVEGEPGVFLVERGEGSEKFRAYVNLSHPKMFRD